MASRCVATERQITKQVFKFTKHYLQSDPLSHCPFLKKSKHTPGGRASPPSPTFLSSSRECRYRQSAPLSHLPLDMKSKQAPLGIGVPFPRSCLNLQVSPREHEPCLTNSKQTLLPPSSDLCLFPWLTSYLQYWPSLAGDSVVVVMLVLCTKSLFNPGREGVVLFELLWVPIL